MGIAQGYMKHFKYKYSVDILTRYSTYKMILNWKKQINNEDMNICIKLLHFHL